MNVVVSTFGSAGDVFPMVGLALALRARGHAVTFATNPFYEPVARRHGLPFEPLGTVEGFHALTRDPELWKPRRGFRTVYESLGPALKQQYDLHTRLGGVGVTNVFGHGALMAREKVGLPVVSVHLQPAVLWSGVAPPALPGMFGPRWLLRLQYQLGVRLYLHPTVARVLDPWRAELGLGRLPRVTEWWHSPDGVVCLFPDWFAPPQPDWPRNLVQTDFPLWNDRSDEGLPAEVAAYLDAGAPPVVFTPGSANLHGRPFFAAGLDACRALGRRAVLLTEFPEQLPTPLPPGVVHFRYVPLDRLLPRAAAFAHHGGVGSMSQALAAGVPQLVMPLAHDQFDTAARVEKLGVGAGVGVAKFTGPRVARALGQLIGSEAVRAACRDAAGRLTVRDGLSRAAAAVEDLVARRPGP